MRNQRKRVQWKDGEANTIRSKTPHPYLNEVPIIGHHQERWHAALLEGALWVLSVSMRPDDSPTIGRYTAHEYPYLVRDHGYGVGGVLFPVGTMAVYMGVHRVEESNRGRMTSVPRHSFLVGGSRFITTNLNDFAPVV